MSRLILYAGANGSGKSTLRAQANEPVDIDIDPDRIAREMNPADPRSVDFAAGRLALQLFNESISRNRSIALETTLSGKTILRRIRDAREAGYDILLQYLGLSDADVNVSRVQARVDEGGHWIDEADIRRRRASSLDNLPQAAILARRTIILDNTGNNVRPVLIVEHGAIRVLDAEIPTWLNAPLHQIRLALAAGDRHHGAPPQDPP